MSKYSPLRDYLKLQSADRVTLSFDQVSEIVGDALPASAYNHNAWWANDPKHVEAQSWLDAGYKTASVSLTSRNVTFVRG